MPEPRPVLRRPSRAVWFIPPILVLVAAVVLYLRCRPQTSLPPPAPPPAQTGAPSPAAPEAPAPAVAPERIGDLLASLSPDKTFRSWLGQGDVVRRWAIVTDNLAEGVSPRKQLGFLAPTAPFTVTDRGGQTVIAEESYRRYDGFANAIASIDAQAVAKVYRELRPAVESAYRALGYPGASLDRVTARALRRLELAPVANGDVVVHGDRGQFEFGDPKLEQLGEVEKHMLRLGPRNERLVQAKVREIERALELPPPGEVTRPKSR
ncbi:MAG TPA: DUF3014 domain-containing protein [Anaeromyxobacteraceae bacterium]|nr:DUF3014 domain-containing protein [Anaeromyxobacteraceae bacterium]